MEARQSNSCARCGADRMISSGSRESHASTQIRGMGSQRRGRDRRSSAGTSGSFRKRATRSAATRRSGLRDNGDDRNGRAVIRYNARRQQQSQATGRRELRGRTCNASDNSDTLSSTEERGREGRRSTVSPKLSHSTFPRSACMSRLRASHGRVRTREWPSLKRLLWHGYCCDQETPPDF